MRRPRVRDCHCCATAGRHGKRCTLQNIDALPLAACSSVQNPATPMSLRSHLLGEDSQSARRNRRWPRWCKTQSSFATMLRLLGAAVSHHNPWSAQVIEFDGVAAQPRALLRGGLFNVLGIDGGRLVFCPVAQCNAVHQSNADRRMSGPIESRFRLDCFIAPDPLRCNNWHCAMTIRSR
jgi:hypothetical protein